LGESHAGSEPSLSSKRILFVKGAVDGPRPGACAHRVVFLEVGMQLLCHWAMIKFGADPGKPIDEDRVYLINKFSGCSSLPLLHRTTKRCAQIPGAGGTK
jgi:hypothetical protein